MLRAFSFIYKDQHFYDTEITFYFVYCVKYPLVNVDI